MCVWCFSLLIFRTWTFSFLHFHFSIISLTCIRRSTRMTIRFPSRIQSDMRRSERISVSCSFCFLNQLNKSSQDSWTSRLFDQPLDARKTTDRQKRIVAAMSLMVISGIFFLILLAVRMHRIRMFFSARIYFIDDLFCFFFIGEDIEPLWICVRYHRLLFSVLGHPSFRTSVFHCSNKKASSQNKDFPSKGCLPLFAC